MMLRCTIGLALFTFLGLNSFAHTPIEDASNAGSARKDGKFTGSPISINLKDADVREVLRLIGDTSGFNIVISPLVQGKITVAMDHVPWDQALDVVLTTMKLTAERNESVLRVLPKETLLAEKQQELDTKRMSMVLAPRITRVFPISYADLTQLSQLLQSFANAQNNLGGSDAHENQVPQTTIIMDSNTQSLIVRDTAENVEKIQKMIALLDVQTPQVLVESKVIEASEDFFKDTEGAFGVGGTQMGFGFNGSQALLGSANDTQLSGASILSLGGRLIGINAMLRAAEAESKIKIVSSPRTVVLSGKTASVSQGETMAKTLVTPGSLSNPATAQIVQVTANTKLNVTPRVTNDGSVFMKIDLARDVLNTESDGTPAIQPRLLSTDVIVESGNTLVIGGVLSLNQSEGHSGIPFLRDIPILGSLFGSSSQTQSKNELMFFITPRILNQRKTALSDEDVKKL